MTIAIPKDLADIHLVGIDIIEVEPTYCVSEIKVLTVTYLAGDWLAFRDLRMKDRD